MGSRSKMGITIAMIFSVVAFILALYDLFSANSPINNTVAGWFITVLILLSVIFSVSMYSTKRPSVLVLNILSIIVTGIIAACASLYWILICMIICLMGCIMYKAGKAR